MYEMHIAFCDTAYRTTSRMCDCIHGLTPPFIQYLPEFSATKQ